jgi:hypothetical protein
LQHPPQNAIASMLVALCSKAGLGIYVPRRDWGSATLRALATCVGRPHLLSCVLCLHKIVLPPVASDSHLVPHLPPRCPTRLPTPPSSRRPLARSPSTGPPTPAGLLAPSSPSSVSLGRRGCTRSSVPMRRPPTVQLVGREAERLDACWSASAPRLRHCSAAVEQNTTTNAQIDPPPKKTTQPAHPPLQTSTSSVLPSPSAPWVRWRAY